MHASPPTLKVFYSLCVEVYHKWLFLLHTVFVWKRTIISGKEKGAALDYIYSQGSAAKIARSVITFKHSNYIRSL